MPYDDSQVRQDALWILESGAEVEVLENQHPALRGEFVVAISHVPGPCDARANTTNGVRTVVWGGTRPEIAYEVAKAILELRKAQADPVDGQATSDNGIAPPSDRWRMS